MFVYNTIENISEYKLFDFILFCCLVTLYLDGQLCLFEGSTPGVTLIEPRELAHHICPPVLCSISGT